MTVIQSSLSNSVWQILVQPHRIQEILASLLTTGCWDKMTKYPRLFKSEVVLKIGCFPRGNWGNPEQTRVNGPHPRQDLHRSPEARLPRVTPHPASL